MAASVETGMSKPDMKRVLKRSSRQEPIFCAIGQGENNALALLLMDKRKQPRALEGDLKKAFPDVRNTRFGTAFVDENEDAVMVQIQLNRAVSGMAKRLVKTLKKTSFTKVRLLTEDGSLVEEMEEADEDAEAETAQGTAPAAPAAPAAPGAQAAAAAAPPPPPSMPEPAATPPAADAGALSKRLAALAAEIPGVAGNDEARKATLLKLAKDANVNIKTNNLTYAANFLAQLEKALGAGNAAPGAAAAPDLSKTRATWAGVRQQVVADVDKLRSALAAAYDGQPVAGEVMSKFGTTVAPLLARFNTRVEDALDGVMKADAADRGAMLDQARAAVKDALAFASSDKLIGDLDDNPFVPLGIRAAATAGLTAVQQAVQ